MGWLEGLLRVELGALGADAGTRFTLDGLATRPQGDGSLEIVLRRLEAASLRPALGPLVLEIGHLALHDLTAQVRIEGGRPRLAGLQAARAELADIHAQGPLAWKPQPAGGAGWSLAPLAAADGTIRAKIVDAQLLFDADVAVPIRGGGIDFNDASVEHVGPDSRMGVSRLGLYVDAPNGRSYLYQFAAPPVSGVEFERRGALLGPWVTSRGKLRLQDFAEALLGQAPHAAAAGFTAQARELLNRTALSGELQLGDGRFGAPGLEAQLTGGGDGRNAIRLQADAVGRGLAAGIPSLSVQDAALQAGALQLQAARLVGALTMRVFAEGARLHAALALPRIEASGLRLAPPDQSATSAG